MSASSLLDLAGIGCGPFTLSVAAHLDRLPEVSAAFFDRRPDFSWHPGMMLPGVELQNSCLKDLVSAADPTNPWSFLSYLVSQKRFYAFLNCEFDAVYRKETAGYFKWVANGLPSLNFGHDVREVSFSDGAFTLRMTGPDGTDITRRSRNLSVGVGVTPWAPDCARRHLGPTCVHASQIAVTPEILSARRIAIIGGGQSGCEVFQALLNRAMTAEDEVVWISRRPTFEPIDASPFTNEYFSPTYSDLFHGLPTFRKGEKLEQQKLASDGASLSTLKAIYRRLYELKHLDGNPARLRLLPNRTLTAMDHGNGQYQLHTTNAFDGGSDVFTADVVILATGYHTAMPECLAPLSRRIRLTDSGQYCLNRDYSVDWDGPAANRLFALNASRHSHGIVDPQLSIAAWRSAEIVNALLERRHFDLTLPPSMVEWASGHTAALRIAAE